MVEGGSGVNVPRLGLWISAAAGVDGRGLRVAPTTPSRPVKVGGNRMQLVEACVLGKKIGYWENECPSGPGVVICSCFMLGLGDMSADSALVCGGSCGNGGKGQGEKQS